VLVDGRPSLFVDKGGSRVLCFEDASDPVGVERLDRAIRALARGVGRIGRKRLSIEEIDGEKARLSSLADGFVRAGFRAGYRALEIDRSLSSDDAAAQFTGEAGLDESSEIGENR
jgi:hypothetical protein